VCGITIFYFFFGGLNIYYKYIGMNNISHMFIIGLLAYIFNNFMIFMMYVYLQIYIK